MCAFIVTVFALLMASGLYASEEGFEYRYRTIKAVKTSQPPKIDGILDDRCWEDAPVAKPFIDSYTGKPAQDQTEAYVLYDEKALYVAFKCFDSFPDRITARETKRDGSPWGDDFVEVAVNPFDTRQFSGRNVFKVNAIGTQFTEIRGGRTEKVEWKGDWHAAISRTDFGWVAEMAIPWDIMDHPSSRKPRKIGINFGRHQARTGVFSFWSYIGYRPYHLEWDGYLLDVVLPRGKIRSLNVLGYALGGTEPEKRRLLRGGLDIRYRPNPQITGLLTVNPDFSSVEQEVESIDFSYVPRAYSDKRPFFQEGREMFGIGWDEFYSRKIGQIDAGLKFYGRLGKTKVGIMDCSDMWKWNLFLASMGREIGKVTSINGSLVRYDGEDVSDTVISLSAGTRFRDLYTGTTLCGDVGEKEKGFKLDTSMEWQGKKVRIGGSLFLVSPGYKPSLGYIPYEPRKGGSIWAGYEEDRFLGGNNSLYASIGWDKYWHYDGREYMGSIHSGMGLNLRMGATKGLYCGIGMNLSRYEEFRDIYGGGGIGGFWRDSKELISLGLGISGAHGRREEKRYVYLMPTIGFGIMKNTFALNYMIEVLSHGDERRRQDVIWLNLNITPEHGFGGKLALREGKWNCYFSYRQAVRKGIDVYIILGDPNAKEFQRRLFIKLIVPIW